MANNGSFKKKVDRAGELDTLIKEMSTELKQLKEDLLAIAEKKNKKVLEGLKFVATISPKSSTKIESRDLLKLLRKKGEEKKFVDLVKVDITSTKRYLNITDLGKIAKVETKAFGKIQLTKK